MTASGLAILIIAILVIAIPMCSFMVAAVVTGIIRDVKMKTYGLCWEGHASKIVVWLEERIWG